MAAEGEEEMVVLRGIDGMHFEVSKQAARQSKTISCMMEYDWENNAIPVAVQGKVLGKVLEYCRRHTASKACGDDGDYDDADWGANFILVEQETLMDLILAAEHLRIQGLLHLACQTVANKTKGKSRQEIRDMFNIRRGFTPEEEAEVEREDRQFEES